jgi:COX assembly protein 1
MNSCMKQYATQDEQDRAREEWFTTRDKRKLEREQKEERRKQQEAFHREWWGLDEQGRKKLDEGRAGGKVGVDAEGKRAVVGGVGVIDGKGKS